MSAASTLLKRQAADIVAQLAQRLSSTQLTHSIADRIDGPYLIFELANPTDRFFRLLEEILHQIPDNNAFKERSTIVRRAAPENRLTIPETNLLRATISEILTVDRYSFEEDFFSRYTFSVTDLERQIVAKGNFIVYGRRGAGKSSLLAYAMHHLIEQEKPFVWVALQTYAGRGDIFVTIEVLREVLEQLSELSQSPPQLLELSKILSSYDGLPDNDAEQRLGRLLPRIREALGKITRHTDLTVFLDDLHVVRADHQARLLGTLYAISRGNRTYIKVSGIEQFTLPWNSSSKVGLEPTHDAQILKLDYNLTVPDKSMAHIVSILDTHAAYCGLPTISYLTRPGVLARLVWVAAAVPRDALSLFSLAIRKATAKNEKKVSVTSVNAAASEMAEEKLKDIDKDVSEKIQDAKSLLEDIKDFCINEHRKNAFLIEIRNSDPVFQNIQRLIALRLIHVLHEGITPHKAGKRYLALMLDYGFYVGIRAATSVDLFQKKPKALTAKELRKLPIFRQS